LNATAPTQLATAGGKIVYSIQSRQELELNLSDLVVDGRLDIFPHVEKKGLLFLQFRRSRLIVTAGGYVGLIPLTPKISIDVRPKLPVSNLARVLDAARRSLSSIANADRLYLASELSNSSVLEFLAANLLDALRPISANGLHKEYVCRSETTSHPRGRIELAGTIRAWSRGQFHNVQAQRFEQSSDLPVNRLIKTALYFILQRMHPYSPESRALIRRANAAYFEMPAIIEEMRSSDYEACKAVLRANSLPTSRSYYYRALEIALLILSNRGIALEEQGSDVLLETFIINFDDLFEEYLRRVLQQRAEGGLIVKDGNREGKKPLFDDQNAPSAQPDIVLTWRPTHRTVVAEVKYKERPQREDINQAITYALCYGTEQAILVHQCGPEAPKGLRPIGTLQGIKVNAYAFDLGADDLDAEEATFANCLFGLVRPPHVESVAA
jgi:5-methylcytosine-specific restriction enzyme subunit McrC